LALAFGMFGVADDEYEVRLTSMSQGLDGDPHVLLALQRLAGFDCEQTFLLFSLSLSSAVAMPAINRKAKSTAGIMVKHR
jgi:hypothetical protein